MAEAARTAGSSDRVADSLLVLSLTSTATVRRRRPQELRTSMGGLLNTSGCPLVPESPLMTKRMH